MRRAIGLAFALVLLMATPAFAHVAVDPPTVAPGEVGVLHFLVPNESSDASTTRVEIVMPTDVELELVAAQPVAGWDLSVQRSGDTITGVTWEGGTIKPGEFESFAIELGPIAGDRLEFKAVQTYDNGDVVRWIEPTVEGQEEPENPAPFAMVGSGNTSDASETGSSDDDGSTLIEFISLAVAGAALVAAAAALIMGRKRVPQ